MSASKKKNPGIADDDRNLVLVDGDFSEADLDDRAWLLWERYKGAFLGAALVALVVGVGFIGWRSFSDSRRQSVGADYDLAETPELKMSFAELNRGEPLAAVAALEAADAAYSKSDYKTAGDRYARAAIFADAAKPAAALVSGRALIGSAVCSIRTGDTAGGVKKLLAIADEPARPAGLRAQSLYLLAENACGAKDFVAAKKYLDRLDRETSDSLAWHLPGSPKSELIRAFPELLAASPTPVPATAKK